MNFRDNLTFQLSHQFSHIFTIPKVILCEILGFWNFPVLVPGGDSVNTGQNIKRRGNRAFVADIHEEQGSSSEFENLFFQVASFENGENNQRNKNIESDNDHDESVYRVHQSSDYFLEVLVVEKVELKR